MSAPFLWCVFGEGWPLADRPLLAPPHLGVLQEVDRLWPLTLKIDRATGPFLQFDMRHGALVTRQGHKGHNDMRHVHFLNSTGDMGINKR